MSEKEVNYSEEALQRFLNQSMENISLSATINRALVDKVSTETIKYKINNQLNSIQTSMYNINPKFNEKSKNYSVINQEIQNVLTDYETTLEKYSDYFDYQLEEAILKKVELESNLIGKIFREENFKKDESKKEREKDSDKLKLALGEKSKRNIEIISKNKKDNKLNLQDIRKIEDSFDLEKEQIQKLDKKVEKIKEKNKTNLSEIAGIEKDIQKVDKQIKDLNEKKRLALEEAMEAKNKEISVNVKKPHVFKRITNFFSYKFNSTKAINKTVLEPLKFRISEFKMEMRQNKMMQE